MFARCGVCEVKEKYVCRELCVINGATFSLQNAAGQLILIIDKTRNFNVKVGAGYIIRLEI